MKPTHSRINKRLYQAKALKKNFGTIQKGHGKAHIQRKSVISQYLRMQGSDKLRTYKDGEINSSWKQDESTSNKRNFKCEYNSKRQSMSKWQKAKLEHQEKLDENKKRQEEIEEYKLQREEIRKRNTEKRLAKFKKLNMKTKRGQPVMKARMELLLEKIEEQFYNKQS